MKYACLLLIRSCGVLNLIGLMKFRGCVVKAEG